MDDKPKICGIRVINRASGEIEAYIPFSKDELDLPGYVEHVERGYIDTPWYTARVYH